MRKKILEHSELARIRNKQNYTYISKVVYDAKHDKETIRNEEFVKTMQKRMAQWISLSR